MKTSEQKTLQKKKSKVPHFLFGMGEERDFLIENLAVMLSSGIGVGTAIDSICKEIRSKQLKHVVENIKEQIDAGSPLWSACQKSGIFPHHAITLIRIGENSGHLPESLKMLAETQKKENAFKSKVRSATIYPIFVLGTVVIVGLGVAWFILPRLSTVFSQMNVKLPAITKVMIMIGTFLKLHGFVAVPLFLVALWLVIYLVFYAPKFNAAGQWLFFAFPPTHKLIVETELSRASFILGNLLSAGMPIVEALDSLSRSTNYYIYRRFYNHLKTMIEDGNNFEKSFQSFKQIHLIMPATIQQMIIVGEQSGSLPETFQTISKNYEEKIETTTKDLATVLEPVLLLIVWIGVLLVAVSVILPIYSLVGGFNQ